MNSPQVLQNFLCNKLYSPTGTNGECLFATALHLLCQMYTWVVSIHSMTCGAEPLPAKMSIVYREVRKRWRVQKSWDHKVSGTTKMLMCLPVTLWPLIFLKNLSPYNFPTTHATARVLMFYLLSTSRHEILQLDKEDLYEPPPAMAQVLPVLRHDPTPQKG